MIPVPWILAIFGSLVTIIVFMATTVFRMGEQSGDYNNRLAQLETWRTTIRQDMHEISDSLEHVSIELGRLSTLIEERTRQRRQGENDHGHRQG